jgi:uncharacterized protein (DUF885 family)
MRLTSLVLIILIATQHYIMGKANNLQNETTKALHALFESEWEYRMQQYPLKATYLGDRRYNDRWPDLSLEAIKRRHEHNLEIVQRLKTFDRNQLSAEDQLNYDLFLKEYETETEGFKYRWYLIPLNQREGIQTQDEISEAITFDTVKDYEDWIARLKSFPVYMDQTIKLMQEGIRERILLPKVVMTRVPAQIDKQIVEDPKESLFYKPFKEFPKKIPSADQARLEEEGRLQITKAVVPAYKKFKDFFVKEYLPASFEKVGIWQLPQGQEMYAYFARTFTTTNLTPQQIHDIGQSEVKRIRAEMEAIMAKVNFKGTLQDFFKHLRTDPRFYFKTSEELLDAYRAMSKRIDPLMVKVVKTLPRMPYGVEPIPSNIAPDTTTAYYWEPSADGSRSGIYFVNLYKPESRPKYEMMALSLHEAVPGHHLQIAIAMEQGTLPKFRRYGGQTSFIEGWGLYAEYLGDELGLYDDPYSKFGQLTYEMWRAVRLVVDTGIHHLQWDRQKAINFFMDNAAKQELDIINEIDRYITWPGQALAYKIGELKIKELRSRANQELGKDFDVKEFHDIVLALGAVPLDILERNVTVWISTKKNKS